jgi:tripartite ATP-independent transporter DctP family solute receptor
MKRTFLLLLAFALSLGIAFGQGGKDGEGKKYTIKLSYTPTTTDPNGSPDVMYGSVFKEYVEKQSEGRIRVDIYPGNQLGSAGEVVQGVSSGAIELAVVNLSILNNVYKPTMLLVVPGLFNTVDECNGVINGTWGQNFFEEVRKSAKIKVLDAGSNGFRNFTNNIREIHNIADAKGITFRVMDSPVSIKMVEAMGARAVPMAGSEMYLAMKQKVVDGQENPILNIIQDKTYEVQKYLTIDSHMASIMAYIMSDTFYTSLPADLQKIVAEGSRLACNKANTVIASLNQNGIEFLKKQGMTVTIPTDEALKDWHTVIFKATQDYVRTQIGDKYVDSLLTAISDYRKNK